MPNYPTIVSAALSDKELQDSINRMVANFDKGLQTMLEHSNEYVGKIQESLQKIGNTDFGAKGSNDGGVAKQTKAQEEFTESFKRSTNEIKKHGKESEMTFDQIANALSQARRTVSDFNTKRASGILPSSDDYKRYEQALARIVEYNDKLKQSALGKAFGNEQAFAFDGNRVVSDITAVDERLKQLGKYYAELEKQSQRTSSSINKQLEDEVGRRNIVIEQMRAYYKEQERLSKEAAKIQNKEFREQFKGALSLPVNDILDAYRKLDRLKALLDEMRNKKKDKIVDISEADINRVSNAITSLRSKIDKMYEQRAKAREKESAAQKKLIDDQYKLAFARTAKIPTDQLDLAQAKLERLQALLRDMRERGILSNAQIASTEAEIRKLEQIVGQVNTAQQQTTQSAQRYTEEIRKQAAAIRATKEWQEKGHVVVGDINYYDKERANVSKRDKQLLLSLEEQIVQAQQKEAQEALVAAEAKRQQAQAAKEAAQASKGVSAYDLGIDPNVSAGRQRQIASTRAASKETEYLRQQVASLLEVEEREIKTANTSSSSYAKLAQYLKHLQSAYQQLGADRIAKGEGTDLANEIQRVQRAMQKLQQTMNRPVSLKDAMGLSEKTLDDISYKMRQLASYRSGLNVDTQKKEIQQVNDEYNRLKKRMDEVMQKNQQMIASNKALGRSWNYMKNRLAFYFTVGAGTQFIKNLIEVRSQYEMNERALGILIDSAERGTQIFNELSQMALVSPYTLIELSAAAKQLTAYDVAAKDVVDTTRRLADMASAVGIPIERLTYALGQIKAYGYLNSRDARMFANAGIPLVKQLSDYYTQLEGRLVSTADVYDRIKKKTIDYEQVVQVINKMTDEGGKFFDFQAKMADTLKVRLANLTLAWNNMLNDIGSSNQGVLTTGIGLLRDMFLHWKDLESAISKVATAFGIYKTAQLVTLIWTGRITTAMGVQELVGKKLQARFASLTIAQKGFVSAATAGWAALAFIVADAWLTISRNMEEIEQLNKSIADGAKESYEAIDKMLHSSEMASTRLSAAQGKLSDTDAAKAWEMLREQIELSAASSKELIAQLIKEPDLNKRVTESFNLAEKIEEANRKLSDLNDSLDVSQNSILGGLFGEGLVEDIDDYNARIKYTSDVAEWASKKNRGFWENAAMGLRALFNEVKDSFGSDANEAQDEIKNFAQKAAQTIKDELGEEGIKDKIQVNEAIARVVRGMEQQFPQIRGKGKVLFETIFYDTMAKEFKGAVDGQAYYYEKFLEQLKKDHASAFSGVTEDINKETFKWSSAQIDAIQKTADKVKKDLPAASQVAIDEILRQLNSTDFKVRIVAEMATTSLDNVQKQFREKFIEKPWIADDKEREKEENEANQRYGTLMRKNTESNAEYEKRISDERKKQLELSQKNADIITKNKGKQEEFSKAVLADAQKQKEAADDWLKAAKDIEDKGGYDFSTKGENSAARKAAKQAESELAKALKDELSTIDKVRSIYKDLTKEGMSHANAVERATRGWDETVNAINRVLQKNGLQKLDLSKFAGIENPRELVNMLQSQLNTLLKRGAKPAEIKELQTKIQTLNVDAEKYDLTKITKGLNNELGKLKDEYELAVELDANPELGDMFADMFGIDTSAFPRTINEFMQMAQQEFEDARKKFNLSESINIFTANSEQWYKWGEAVGYSKEQVDDFKKSFDGSVAVAKKWAQDVVKQTQDLQYKLADNNGKIAIEEEKLANLRIRLANEVNDEQGRLLKLQIQDQQNAIAKLKEELLQLLPTYQRLFGEVAEHSAWMTRKLARDYKNMLVEGKNRGLNSDNTYSVRDPITGQIAHITKERMGKEIKNADKELQKTQSTVKKITEAFTKGEDGVVDWVHGVELVGEELGKMGQLVDVVGNIADAFSNPDEYNETAEAIHDIAASLQGVSTASKGIGQIASGDYIGGAVSVASGLFSAISTWFDNDDKKILQQIKDSERAVKRLELAYVDLQQAVDKAYGTTIIGARQATLANKELQLAEIKRQIQLEKSRDSKNRDEDKIIDLQKQYRELFYEIRNGYTEIVDDLMGTDVGSFAENLVSSMIDAFKQGEDYMKVFSDKFDEMIDNMIMKSIVSRVVSQYLDAVWEDLDKRINERSKDESDELAKMRERATEVGNMSDDEIMKLIARQKGLPFYIKGSVSQSEVDEYRKAVEKEAEAAQKRLDAAAAFTGSDVDYIMGRVTEIMPELGEKLKNILGEYYKFGESSDKNLSALQQGIQGITEDTAGALEAITNGISQQSYLQSDLLTQIRDAVVGIDIDVQVATQAQMLLQLQQSYAVQMAIQGILEGALTPSGRAFSVELVS